MAVTQTGSRLGFGVYEVNLATGELWRSGYRIKLQSQPFKVLAVLLERPGELVTREELQVRLWGADTAGDFEHALATAIKKIREALRDSAENPRFVETLARRGYRFIAPVTVLTDSPATAPIAELADINVTTTVVQASEAGEDLPSQAKTALIFDNMAVAIKRPFSRKWWMPLSVGAIVVAGSLGIGFILKQRSFHIEVSHIEQLTHSAHVTVALDVTERVNSAISDGYHIVLPVLDRGRPYLATLPVTGGVYSLLDIPDNVAAPSLGDISPDGSRLLMRNHLSPESEQPLWVVPTAGGSAYRVGDVLAQDATFMPDGKSILFAAGSALYITPMTGDHPQVYANLPGRAFWLRWNPAGTLLRFTLIDPLSHTESLWQLSVSSRKSVPILDGFSSPHMECCGVWTSDGRAFVFQAHKGENWDLWALPEDRKTGAERITNGPLQFTTPVTARSGNAVYFLGVDSASKLSRLAPNGQLLPGDDFLSAATRLEFSHDKKRVAWVDQVGRLWCATSEGKKQLQLTPDDLNVFLARWSPDDSRLALMARAPGQVWRIYLINANGGTPQPLLNSEHNAADPSWSPDGQSLVFGRTNDIFGKENSERQLYVLHLATGVVEQIPGSTGLFSPRWSPDGQYIMALTLDQREERLYALATRIWTVLSKRSGADPVWSSDSRYIYFHELLDPAHSIDRVDVRNSKLEQLIRLSDQTQDDPVDYTFAGLSRNDEPLIVSRTNAANIYSLHLK